MISGTRRALLAGIAISPFAGMPARAAPVGRIIRFDPALDPVLNVTSPLEVIANGYRWAEGPVWVRDGGYLKMLGGKVRAQIQDSSIAGTGSS